MNFIPRKDFLIINLLKFFKIKAKFHKHKHHSLIKEIKKELRKYKKNLEINRTVEEDLEKKKEVDFINTNDDVKKMISRAKSANIAAT